MRLLSCFAFLAAALSASTADACCFLKCFSKSSSQVQSCRPFDYVTPSIKIYSVDGVIPTDGDCGKVHSGKITILVDVYPQYTWNEVYLFVTELDADGKPLRSVPVRYSPNDVLPVTHEEKVGATKANVAKLEYAFRAVKLEDGHKYSAYAQGVFLATSSNTTSTQYTSDPVKFYTSSYVADQKNEAGVPATKK